jgi:hypothetical protein
MAFDFQAVTEDHDDGNQEQQYDPMHVGPPSARVVSSAKRTITHVQVNGISGLSRSMLSLGPTGHQVPDENAVRWRRLPIRLPRLKERRTPAIKSRMHRETAKHGPSRPISYYSPFTPPGEASLDHLVIQQPVIIEEAISNYPPMALPHRASPP